MSVVERTTAVQQPLYQNVFVENIPNLHCKSLTKCGLASKRETEKTRLSVGIVSVSVRYLYPARYRHGGNPINERYESWSQVYLLVEMFHRGGTEKDEETDPERGSLKGDRFVGFFSAFFCVIGLEEHRIEEKREKTENEKQLDKENGQIFRMMLDPAAGLGGDELIDVVEIDAARKQQDD